MSDYPFFIPEVVLFANSSLFWFKVANEHREFRNYLLLYSVSYFSKAQQFFKPLLIIFLFIKCSTTTNKVNSLLFFYHF